MTGAGRRLALADVTIEISPAVPRLEQYLDWHFGPLPDSAADPDLVLRVLTGDLQAPSALSSKREGPIRRWEDSSGLVLVHDDGGGAQLGGSELLLWCPPGDNVWRVLRQLLFSALSWLLDRRGLLMLHGGLVGRADTGVLLLGPTGAGKSTLAISALAAGWDLLSDDLVVVGPGLPTRVFGVPKRAMVDVGLATRLSLPLEGPGADERGRRLLPADAFTVGWRRVGAVVVVDHDVGDGALSRLDHAEGLGSLLPSFLDAAEPESLRRQLGTLAALAAVPVFRLAHAADVQARPDRSVELLEQVWQSVRECG